MHLLAALPRFSAVRLGQARPYREHSKIGSRLCRPMCGGGYAPLEPVPFIPGAAPLSNLQANLGGNSPKDSLNAIRKGRTTTATSGGAAAKQIERYR